MKNVSVKKITAELSEILSKVEAGEEIVISSDGDRKPLAVLIPLEIWKKNKKRELGTLQNKGSVTFASDFKMTDEELLKS